MPVSIKRTSSLDIDMVSAQRVMTAFKAVILIGLVMILAAMVVGLALPFPLGIRLDPTAFALRRPLYLLLAGSRKLLLSGSVLLLLKGSLMIVSLLGPADLSRPGNENLEVKRTNAHVPHHLTDTLPFTYTNLPESRHPHYKTMHTSDSRESV
jgi:hypothetical protein